MILSSEQINTAFEFWIQILGSVAPIALCIALAVVIIRLFIKGVVGRV